MMFKVRTRLLRAIVAAGVAAAALMGLGSTAALGFDFGPPPVTLNGSWAPFNRCPVDDPAILSADGAAKAALCTTVSGASATLTIGKFTAPLGGINTQAGLILNNIEGIQTLVAPAGGALVGTPSQLPGGLQALVCPSSAWALRELCRAHPDRFLNSVVTTLSSAGDPSNFSLFAGLQEGVPILTLPLKLHIESPLLGEHCYIGSDKEPMVMQPENLSAPTLNFGAFDANGTPDPVGAISEFILTGTQQGDKQLAIPRAHGCGFAGLLDGTIDGHLGLPSPSGSNAIVLNEVTSQLAGLGNPEEAAPNEGHVLSSDWHSAVQHGHGHHW